MSQTQLTGQLARFETAGLVRRVQQTPEIEYWFKHALIQQAVYDSLLKAARTDLHGRVADAVEQLTGADDMGERDAVLTLHYERAGRPEQAFRCAMRAAERARRTYAYREAVDYYTRALQAAATLNAPALTADVQMIYLSRGSIHEISGDHVAAQANYREMLAAARRAGDLAMQVAALNHLVTVQILYAPASSDLAGGIVEALELAQQTGDPILVGRALWNRGLAVRFHDADRALMEWQQALELAQSTDAPGAKELAANLLLDMSVGHVTQARVGEALRYRRQATEALRTLDDRHLLADALGGLALIHMMRGDTLEARQAAEEGLAISQSLNNPWGVIYNVWTLIQLDIAGGFVERGLARAEANLPTARALGFSAFIGIVLMLIAEAHAHLGQVTEQLRSAEESHDAFLASRESNWEVWGAGVLAGALIGAGDLDGAATLLEPFWGTSGERRFGQQGFFTAGPALARLALGLYRRDGDRPALERRLESVSELVEVMEREEAYRIAWEIRLERGRALLAAGSLDEATADLEHIRPRLADAGLTVLLWQADAALAEAARQRGHPEAAADALGQAKALVMQLAGRISAPALRSSFLARADVRAVLRSSDKSP